MHKSASLRACRCNIKYLMRFKAHTESYRKRFSNSRKYVCYIKRILIWKWYTWTRRIFLDARYILYIVYMKIYQSVCVWVHHFVTSIKCISSSFSKGYYMTAVWCGCIDREIAAHAEAA